MSEFNGLQRFEGWQRRKNGNLVHTVRCADEPDVITICKHNSGEGFAAVHDGEWLGPFETEEEAVEEAELAWC